jgi:hypothetical protein
VSDLWSVYLLDNSKSAHQCEGVIVVFNATFNDISVILWQTDLLVEETIENHRPAISHYFILNIFYCQANKQTIDQTQVIRGNYFLKCAYLFDFRQM